MVPTVVIIGGGTGGTLVANRLHRELGDAVSITVVDPDHVHLYQPGLLFVPFGMADPAKIVRARRGLLAHDVHLCATAVDSVDIAHEAVHLADGTVLFYDVLIIASGARLLPEETEGMAGAGWRRNVFDFYTLDGARALAEALEGFRGGRVVVNPVELPIKCPVAPLEFCFLADWYFRRRGIRDDVELTYATSLDAAFTKPIAARHLGHLLDDRAIAIECEFATGSVDGAGGRLISYDEREIPFDLLVTVPLHGGAAYVERSDALGDELGFVETDAHTLQSVELANIFAIGDATNLPTSKAGSVTHFEGETLVANVIHHLRGEELEGSYDGHANCFIETGFHRALNIDFDYDNEPVPGRPTHFNHLGKLAFQWLYWHWLLPGHDLPGMPRRTKEGAAA